MLNKIIIAALAYVSTVNSIPATNELFLQADAEETCLAERKRCDHT